MTRTTGMAILFGAGRIPVSGATKINHPPDSLLRRRKSGVEGVAGDLPQPLDLAQQEQFLVAPRNLGAVGEALDDTR